MQTTFQEERARREIRGSSECLVTEWGQEPTRQQYAASRSDGVEHSLFVGLGRLRRKWQIKGNAFGQEYKRVSIAAATLLEFAGWQIDLAARQLYDPTGGEVSMTGVEFDLLAAFCRNLHRVLSRAELVRLSHSGLAGPSARSIDVHVSRIRRKIEPNPHHPIYIKTIHSRGYVFTPAMRAL